MSFGIISLPNSVIDDFLLIVLLKALGLLQGADSPDKKTRSTRRQADKKTLSSKSLYSK